MSRQALVIVDMLNDFVTGSLACERAQRILPPLEKLVKEARKANVPVIYSNDSHRLGTDHELDLWGDHAIEGTPGAEVIPQIAPVKGDFIVPKRKYSGFFQTDMHLLLKELDVDTLIITGLHAHMCVRHTAADAYQWGFKVVVPTDGVEAFTQEDFDAGIEYLKTVYGAKITDIESVAAAF